MAKAAIVVLADPDDASGTGRMANALITAREFKEEGDEVAVVFDGAGVRWVPRLTDPEHKYSRLLDSLEDRVAGAYGVREEIEASEVPLISEYRRHPSLRAYAAGLDHEHAAPNSSLSASGGCRARGYSRKTRPKGRCLPLSHPSIPGSARSRCPGIACRLEG